MNALTLTRLQKGMTVLWHNRPHKVIMVNDCRALVRPCAKEVVEIRGRRIRVTPHCISISPNSELEIVKVARRR